MKDRISVLTKSVEERKLLVAALYAMGYHCGSESTETYLRSNYCRIFIYSKGELGGNEYDTIIDGDVSIGDALATAVEWRASIRELKLNSEYTAVIEGDEVVVGCQRFPASKVLELAKLIKGK